MVYDSMRRLSAYVFGGTYPRPGTRCGRSTPPRASGAAPPREHASGRETVRGARVRLARHRDDVGGIRDENTLYNDTWIYRPGTRQWQQLVPPASPPSTGMNSEDLASENDVFILHQNGEFWVFRYASSSSQVRRAR